MIIDKNKRSSGKLKNAAAPFYRITMYCLYFTGLVSNTL